MVRAGARAAPVCLSKSTMRLAELITALPAVLNQVNGGVEIRSVIVDSRQVQPGDLFIAIPGVYIDGHRFIVEAVTKGAVAVVGERALSELFNHPDEAFTYVRVSNAREAWGWLCASRYDFPSQKMTWERDSFRAESPC